ESQIYANRIRNVSLELFVAGSFFLGGIYYFILFLSFKKRYILFYFSMLCFIIFIRSLVTGEMAILYLTDFSWLFARRMEYITFYLSVPIMSLFSYYLFPHEFSKKILYIILSLCALFVTVGLFASYYIFTYPRSWYQAVMLFAAFYGLYVYVNAAKNKRPGSKLFLLGFVVFIITITNDILYANLSINSVPLFYVGLFLFAIILSILLSGQFGKTFADLQVVNASLHKANEELGSMNKEINEKNSALEFSATVSDSIADAVISTSTQQEGYNITGWNKAAELMYGWKAEEVIGKPAHEIITINSSEEQRKLWQAILDTNGFWKGEVVQKKKDGKNIHVLASVAYVKNKDGKILGTVGVNRDISEQKKAEIELRRAKEQLEITFKNVPSGIYQFNNQQSIEYINERGAKLMGYDSVEQVMAAPNMQQFVKHLNDTFTILDEAGNKRQDEKSSVYIAITTGKSAEITSQFINKKDGTALWVLSNSTPVYDEAGKLSFVLTTVTDVTESKKAEIALRESENRFRTLAEALPQMVWVRNANGIIEYGSKGWERYSGIKNVSEAWKAMLHPDEWNMIMEKWEEDSEAGRPFRYEVRIKSKEGEYRWHYTAGEPVKDESGKVLKWIGALTDIHVQKTFSEKLEQEVAQRTEELVKANKELESFNYIASHDLQEPLRKIQTFILLIEKHKNNEEITRKYFEKVKSSAQRMSELIQSILNYSRISKTGLDYNHIDLNKILDDVLTDFELLIKEKNAIIKSDKFPIIEANALQMHQLFSNLISNSLKFSKDAPQINIQSKIVTGDKVLTKELINPKQQYTEITFSDNGIGFSQEYSEQIFQLFQRLHGKEEYSGTGIGLSIVKKIIEQHKGFVTVHSVLEKGTTFIIWLPVNHLKKY
ncbi:MAG TPA: PAS domain S-box protein, partial [Parafilimonas sp.]|nr:PAS domain S-box protein [Parafilimonas sp.]